MEKLIYQLGSDAAPETLRETLLGPVAMELQKAGAVDIEVFVRDIPEELLGGLFRADQDRMLSAVVSVWLPSLDTRDRIEGPLRPLADRFAGYLVAESLPREYASRPCALGERSPGVCFVTTLRKREDIDDETFFRNWHGSHTPLSLEIHPLTRYVRNTVVRSLTPDAPPHRTIVCESVGTIEEAVDPKLFYSSKEGEERARKDLATFVDFKTLSTVIMSEYLVVDGPWKPR